MQKYKNTKHTMNIHQNTLNMATKLRTTVGTV